MVPTAVANPLRALTNSSGIPVPSNAAIASATAALDAALDTALDIVDALRGQKIWVGKTRQCLGITHTH